MKSFRSVRIGNCVGNREYEVYVGGSGDKRIWDERDLRNYIYYYISKDISYTFTSHIYNGYKIAELLTVLVMLGVGI